MAPAIQPTSPPKRIWRSVHITRPTESALLRQRAPVVERSSFGRRVRTLRASCPAASFVPERYGGRLNDSDCSGSGRGRRGCGRGRRRVLSRRRAVCEWIWDVNSRGRQAMKDVIIRTGVIGRALRDKDIILSSVRKSHLQVVIRALL
jgi:hypothetical protein